MRVFLKSDEEVRKLTGFNDEKFWREGRECHCFSAFATQLRFEDGRWFFDLESVEDQIPAGLVCVVEEISSRHDCHLGGFPKREAGIYRHESAEAEVMPASTK